MRMMRMFGHAALGLIFAAAISVAPLRAADTVTIGTVGSPSANLWPVFIGIDKGFFTAQNVKADVVYIQSSASVIQQLSAGSLDMSMSTGLVDPIRAIDQGAAIALARFEVQAPPYALLAKASIKSLKDLKGKVISVGGPKDITRIYVERMLAPQGLKTGDYDFVYAAPPAPAPRPCSAAPSMPRSCCRHPTFRFRMPATTILGSPCNMRPSWRSRARS